MIKHKRIYDKYEKNDGFRILVDRLWPRGISKEDSKIDLWLKDIAPSDSLRKWFNHDPEKWDEFQQKYKKELKDNSEILQTLIEIIENKKNITLLYAAKDTEHNNAIILKRILGTR